MIIMVINNKKESYFQEMMSEYVDESSLMDYLEPYEQLAIIEMLNSKEISGYTIEPLHIQGRHGVFIDLRYSNKILKREELIELSINSLYSVIKDRIIFDGDEVMAIQLFTFMQCVQPSFSSLISEWNILVELKRRDLQGKIKLGELDKEKISARQHEIAKAFEAQNMVEDYVEVIENQSKSVEMIKENATDLIAPIKRHYWF